MNDTIDLSGCWHLKAWTISYSDDRTTTMPFGEQPIGFIMYTKEGWMSASICRRDRSGFSQSLGLRHQPDTVLANAYRDYFHYAGPYVIEGDTVLHTVEQSLNPDFVGSVQKRQIELQGDRLCLSGVDSIGEVQRYHRLVWSRAAAAVTTA